MRAELIALAAIIAGGCEDDAPPPEGHVRVFLDTDAPLPRTGRSAPLEEPQPLLDTVRVEIVAPDGAPACDRCAREFALDERLVDDGASFTVLERPSETGSGALLHAVAFRAATLRTAAPGAWIETWARVPSPPREGSRDVTLALGMETFGRSLGSREAPITLAEGRPARPRARWPRAVRSGCEGPARPGAVCVPGGAFWMGSPDDPVFPNLLAPRVVAVSAFYLDRTEVTVRDYRERVGAGPLPRAWSGSLAGTRADDFCTYTPEPGRFDDFAVNCISWQSARSYCVALGGDLPTEAQREYVASALQGLPYLWGRDRPSCADAFLAAGPRSERFSPTAGAYHTSCRATTPRDDLEAIGFSRPVTGLYGRDALALPGGVVQDLVGNLAEWVRDDWQPRSGSCWSDPRVLVDPTCVVDPSAPRTLRGGSWVGATVDSDAWLRQPLTDEPGTTGLAIGFRCAYVTK